MRFGSRWVLIVCLAVTALLLAAPALHAQPGNASVVLEISFDGGRTWQSAGAGSATPNWQDVFVRARVVGNPIAPWNLVITYKMGDAQSSYTCPRTGTTDPGHSPLVCELRVPGKIDASWTFSGVLYQNLPSRPGGPLPQPGFRAAPISSPQTTVAWGVGGGGVSSRAYKCSPSDRIFFTVGATQATAVNCGSVHLPLGGYQDYAHMQHVPYGTSLTVSALLSGQLDPGWVMTVMRSLNGGTVVCPTGPDSRCTRTVTLSHTIGPEPPVNVGYGPVAETLYVQVRDNNLGRGKLGRCVNEEKAV
jgi:hypothetical protein